MYEKLLDSKLKVTMLIVFIALVAFSIMRINREEKRAEDRPMKILPEDAVGVPLPPGSSAYADVINSDFRNDDSDNKSAKGELYIYNPTSTERSPLVKEATPAQIRTAAEMPPELRKLQDAIYKASKTPIPPPVVKVTKTTKAVLKDLEIAPKEDAPEDADE